MMILQTFAVILAALIVSAVIYILTGNIVRGILHRVTRKR